MVYRIAPKLDGDEVLFEGLLDAPALQDLRARVAGRRSRLVLGAGTRLDPSCLEGLLALEVELVSESPFLAQLLSACRGGLR